MTQRWDTPIPNRPPLTAPQRRRLTHALFGVVMVVCVGIALFVMLVVGR